jgi:phosphoesterase RecJ-like protein
MMAPSSGEIASTASIEQAVDAIHQAQSILCLSHVAPDGDAVGSLLGMGWILRALGKDPILALQDAPDPDLSYLPGFGEIRVGAAQVKQARSPAMYDLVIALDASSVDRLGSFYQAEEYSHLPLLVIDHHITNTYFGTSHWVDPSCAATCQMLIYLTDALGVPLAGEIVPPLLTGLVTDTLCFRTSNTDSRTLEAAMRLTAAGGNLNQIVQQTMMRQPLSKVRLWSKVLPHVQLSQGVIWLTVSRAQKAQARAGNDAGDGLANFLVTVNEANISAVFTEKQDENGPSVECSFRARPGYNVGQAAFALGGGGHPAAAGCTLPGTLGEVVPKVVATLQSVPFDTAGQ